MRHKRVSRKSESSIRIDRNYSGAAGRFNRFPQVGPCRPVCHCLFGSRGSSSDDPMAQTLNHYEPRPEQAVHGGDRQRQTLRHGPHMTLRSTHTLLACVVKGSRPAQRQERTWCALPCLPDTRKQWHTTALLGSRKSRGTPARLVGSRCRLVSALTHPLADLNAGTNVVSSFSVFSENVPCFVSKVVVANGLTAPNG
jgi:hypothetical protein